MSNNDYFRPRGDITTILDLTDRDSQDNTYFPITAEKSWFHRETEQKTVYPTTVSVQEFPQRGPANWGQRFSFEIGSLPAGDLLQSIMLQIKLGSWYNPTILNRLNKAEITTDLSDSTYYNNYWTFSNSLGTSIIEYAEFIVNDQTIEKLTGEFIRTFYNVYADVNSLIGLTTDGIGTTPYSYLSTPSVTETSFHPRRAYPTEDGTYFCILPFFFLRTRLKEVFPLLSCNEGSVRIDIKLRPFDQLVRKYIGYRSRCDETPLNTSVTFKLSNVTPNVPVTTETLLCPPEFRDFRIITCCALTTGSLRSKFLHQPFEQMIKLVQTFHFDEPLKYLRSKPNPNSDTVEIQLPLELNHPVVELLWVFRRKAVLINNEWSNFTPVISLETNPSKVYPAWLDHATIQLNGSELISAEGNWFREHIGSIHRGGLVSFQSYVYGYSFSRYPDDHQPSGSANMSRTTSIMLNLKVNTPINKDISTLSNPSCEFDINTVGGWEVFVFAIHYNWLRFENGICNRMFSD
jgi:hypothetical protein